jgi:hypothetical protein
MRARRAVNEAEEKLRLIKKWTLDFDNRVQPLVKELENLRTLFANDMPRAVLKLAQLTKTLDAYAGIQTHSSGLQEGATEIPAGPTEPEIQTPAEDTAPKENA